MRLRLENIDYFIKKYKVKEVTSSQILSGKGFKPDPSGLWSEEIFGLLGSTDRVKTFGYIDLQDTVIHPEVFDIICLIHTSIKSILTCKGKYVLEEGKFVEDPNGRYGIDFFIESFDKIDFEFYKDQKEDNDKIIDFILKNKDLIFINKWLVLPAGVRDLHIDPTTKRVSFSDINNLYLELLRLISLRNEFERPIYLKFIEDVLVRIVKWIHNKQAGKFGLFRGLLLRKVTDFSARCVITTNPDIPLGKVGVPWHVLFPLYEPFCFNYILKKDKVLADQIKQFLKVDELNIDQLKEFTIIIQSNYDIIPNELKEPIIKMLTEIVKDKQILYKRDPVVSRTNWRAGEIIVTDTHSIVLNPLDLVPLSGDLDGDTVAVFPLFTKKANESAKILNPRYNKMNYYNPVTIHGLSYSVTLDAVATIYEATRE